MRIGEYVAENGIAGDGPYQTARDLILKLAPTIIGQSIQNDGESTLDAAIRIAQHMEKGVLPIQGPPGTGKSYTGARMICTFVAAGMKVGITAGSHKVIRNLLNKVIEAAAEMNIELCCVQKPEKEHIEDNHDHLVFARDTQTLLGELSTKRCMVAGATAFLWATPAAQDVLDVLFVDEAAQMSLANVLSVSHTAKRLVLLGDRAPTQRFVDQFATYYTPTIVVLAILIAVLPPLFFDEAFSLWIYRALVTLVIACPCALVWMAVFADLGASLIVVFNGLRLLKFNSSLGK